MLYISIDNSGETTELLKIKNTTQLSPSNIQFLVQDIRRNRNCQNTEGRGSLIPLFTAPRPFCSQLWPTGHCVIRLKILLIMRLFSDRWHRTQSETLKNEPQLRLRLVWTTKTGRRWDFMWDSVCGWFVVHNCTTFLQRPRERSYSCAVTHFCSLALPSCLVQVFQCVKSWWLTKAEWQKISHNRWKKKLKMSKYKRSYSCATN